MKSNRDIEPVKSIIWREVFLAGQESCRLFFTGTEWRLDENADRYESAGGQFVAELKVNPSGFVIDYPALWQAEAFSES